MQLDRSALADITRPREMAVEIHRQLGDVVLPVPIAEIALANGADEIKDVGAERFEGALLTWPDKHSGTILVREGMMLGRRRFTIAHELGHLYLHWHRAPGVGFQCFQGDMWAAQDGKAASRADMEGQANDFAVEMLLPEKHFCADLKKLTEPGLEHVADLAKTYGTSMAATLRRFIGVHGDPMAMVLSKDGQFQYCLRQSGFPFIALEKGMPVHRKCHTSMFEGVERECSGTDSIEPALWVNAPLRHGQEMYEQVMVQGSGYRLTLLSIGGTDDDEDEDEEEDRTPRFAYGR